MSTTAAGPGQPAARGSLSRILNLAGAVVVGWAALVGPLASRPAWVSVLVAVGLAAWVVGEFVPPGSAWFWPPMLIALAAGSIAGPATLGLGAVPAVIAIVRILADPARKVVAGLIAVAVSAVVVAASGLIIGASTEAVLTSLGLVILAGFLGLARRQSRAAALRDRELLAERARTATLAERSRIARELHDVLAHTLGGLVIQLDAVDAELEAGRVVEARGRVGSARDLAASGLDEARQAVDALNEQFDLAAAIADLIELHRALGASVELSQRGTPGQLDPLAAIALRRAVQEGLSNARKHAPGATSRIEWEWTPDRVRLVIRTPLSTEESTLSDTGSGRGLAGLRARFEEAGGSATSGIDGDAFQITASVPR